MWAPLTRAMASGCGIERGTGEERGSRSRATSEIAVGRNAPSERGEHCRLGSKGRAVLGRKLRDSQVCIGHRPKARDGCHRNGRKASRTKRPRIARGFVHLDGAAPAPEALPEPLLRKAGYRNAALTQRLLRRVARLDWTAVGDSLVSSGYFNIEALLSSSDLRRDSQGPPLMRRGSNVVWTWLRKATESVLITTFGSH